jgi:hypothetical protein
VGTYVPTKALSGGGNFSRHSSRCIPAGTTPSRCIPVSPFHKNHEHPPVLPTRKHKRKKEKSVWPTNSSPQKASTHPHYPLPPPTLHTSTNLHFTKHKTSRHEHILRIMPPRRTRQPPAHNLSWFSAPRCWATLHLRIKEHDCRRLERFRHHIRIHDIPYFCASHQVFALGPHSRQYFRISLRLLLTLDYVPRKLKIPVRQLPHDCRFCQEVTRRIFQHRRPFEYVTTIPRLRGQPRKDTIPPVSSTKESESESDSDDSEPTPPTPT